MLRQATAIFIAIGMALPLGGAALAQTGGADRTRASSADRQFMLKAAEGNLAEVALGQLAERKGQSDAVKQFGHRMSDDHSKAMDELKALADREGVALPQHMSARDQKIYDRLAQLTPERFDSAYSRDMVRDHQKDVREFEREAKNGHDPDVKAWAGKTVPTLREHLQMAREIAPAAGSARAR